MNNNKGAKPEVCIILVNFNGWQDTLECVESLLSLTYPNFRIIIIDNGSTDSSVQEIINWAAEKLPVLVNQNNNKIAVNQKQIVFKHIVDTEITSGIARCVVSKEIVLIASKVNLGFAGGNNIGTNYALAASDVAYVWYLNNDTVADTNALDALINYFEDNPFLGTRLGIVGSKLRYYHNRKVIQAIGGFYNKWFAYTKHVGTNELDVGQYDYGRPLPKIDYVVGASMLVSIEFIQQVGLMNPDYFLYFEEIDWITRGQALGFTYAYCANSLIYHKEGQSTGGNSNIQNKSYIADFYGVKNRIKFTRKFYPGYLFTVYLSLIGGMINRIKRKQYKRVVMIAKIILNSLISSK